VIFWCKLNPPALLINIITMDEDHNLTQKEVNEEQDDENKFCAGRGKSINDDDNIIIFDNNHSHGSDNSSTIDSTNIVMSISAIANVTDNSMMGHQKTGIGVAVAPIVYGVVPLLADISSIQYVCRMSKMRYS
jgi:hypothetical protein